MPRILIIEDDGVTAKMYGDFLRRAGFDVDHAVDGLAGLAFLETGAPDALVVDIMMPRMNGIDFIKRLRGIERFGKTPVLAYTTAFVPQLVDQARTAGATEVFDKSKLNGTLLKASLQQHLLPQ